MAQRNKALTEQLRASEQAHTIANRPLHDTHPHGLRRWSAWNGIKKPAMPKRPTTSCSGTTRWPTNWAMMANSSTLGPRNLFHPQPSREPAEPVPDSQELELDDMARTHQALEAEAVKLRQRCTELARALEGALQDKVTNPAPQHTTDSVIRTPRRRRWSSFATPVRSCPSRRKPAAPPTPRPTRSTSNWRPVRTAPAPPGRTPQLPARCSSMPNGPPLQARSEARDGGVDRGRGSTKMSQG